jgi:hypothetical protein
MIFCCLNQIRVSYCHHGLVRIRPARIPFQTLRKGNSCGEVTRKAAVHFSTKVFGVFARIGLVSSSLSLFLYSLFAFRAQSGKVR